MQESGKTNAKKNKMRSAALACLIAAAVFAAGAYSSPAPAYAHAVGGSVLEGNTAPGAAAGETQSDCAESASEDERESECGADVSCQQSGPCDWWVARKDAAQSAKSGVAADPHSLPADASIDSEKKKPKV